MFRLQTIDPKDAIGPVAEVFNSFPPQVGVPGPLLMMSASPDIVGLQGQFFKYFRAHPHLGFKLQALIRYLVAADLGYSYCVAFNGNLLHSVGLTDVELEAVHADLAQAPLEDKEKALLSFVMATLRQPEQTQDAEIAALRAAGWQDSDIFDALWIGAGMIAAGTLYKALSRPGAPGGA